MNWTVPPRVKRGDTVAVVSPSFGAVGAWPHRAERGEAYLESLGLRVKLMPHAAEVDGWVAGSPEARADDIHSAFADPEVTVVLAGIGGNHSNQLLPLLDYDLIRANPKIFQGYSDITMLHYAFLKHAGLATYYGDAFTLGLAEYPKVFDYTDRWLRAAWFRQEPLSDRPDSDGAAPKELRFEAATEWTEEFMDFDQKLDLTRPRTMRPSEGWVTIRDGMAEGPIVGGCLETICWHLKGSNAWIQPAGCIFFFETSEEAPSPAHVEAYLTDLAHLGVFDDAVGLLVGRPMGYSDEDRALLWDVVRKVTEPSGIPLLANIDCGHTDPMLTLPLGLPAVLDAGAQTLSVQLER